MPKNPTLERAEEIHLQRQGDGMTTEELMRVAIKTAQHMSPDESAHLRARMKRWHRAEVHRRPAVLTVPDRNRLAEDGQILQIPFHVKLPFRLAL
jgi:hypothetical protein